MTDTRTTTLLVEPDFAGHHLQSVSTVARLARKNGPVVLLTSRGASADPAFDAYIADDVANGVLQVVEEFDDRFPATSDQAQSIGQWCRDGRTDVPVSVVVLLDADRALKRWWYSAPRHLRGLTQRPRVIFMLTRYPARLAVTDLTGWRLRTKALFAMAAMATGSVQRVVGYAGREDASRGWLVKRVRDPEYCTAHSRDRDRWRAEYGLPPQRKLVGIFGVIWEWKNAPLILDAIRVAGLDADLLLAGALAPEVRAWVDGLDKSDRARLIVRDAYLSNEELDRLVASVDVVPLALTNNGPSGIMGKAEAAGVPVVTAGSRVRAREARATGAGLACELDADSIGRAMRQIFEGAVTVRTGAAGPQVLAEEYAMILLGLDAEARPLNKRRRRIDAAN